MMTYFSFLFSVSTTCLSTSKIYFFAACVCSVMYSPKKREERKERRAGAKHEEEMKGDIMMGSLFADEGGSYVFRVF